MSDIIDITIVDNTGKVAARLENVVEDLLDKAALKLDAKVKRKFSKSARFGHSKPGQYPRSINGHAMRNVRIRRVSGQNVIRVEYGGSVPRHSLRIRMLSKDTTIKSKGKSLAIPLTWEAKKFASNVRNSGQTIRDFKPGGQEMEWIPGKNGDSFLAVKAGILKRATGQKYKRHFLLTKRTVHRKARKGMVDAMREEEKWFVNYITKGVESQFGAP